jgi:hypothetical protein
MKGHTGVAACVFAGVLAAAMTTSPKANALGPLELEIAGEGGWATMTDAGSTNVFGPHIGGRAGVTIFSYYLGLQGLNYFGQNSFNAVQLGGQLGYQFKLPGDILRIRPRVGLGQMIFNGPDGLNDKHFYLEPGITGIIPLGPIFFIGADAAWLFPALDQASSGIHSGPALRAEIGVKF